MFDVRPFFLKCTGALAACSLVLALPAQAEIYKYVDEKGHVTYSNKPIKGGKKVELPEISTVPAPKLETPPTPARSAATDPAEQRKQALREKIAAAEKALADAKQAYQEGSEKPEVFVRADGSRGRNMAAYEEKMKRLKEEVDRRQKELDELRAELASLEGRTSLSPGPSRSDQPR